MERIIPNLNEYTRNQIDIIEAISNMDKEKCPSDININSPSCRCGPYIIYWNGGDVRTYDINEKKWTWDDK